MTTSGRFRLTALFYATSVTASAVAAFGGVGGLLLAFMVLAYWLMVFVSAEPGRMALVLLGLLVIGCLALPAVGTAKPSVRRAGCLNNIKCITMALHEYAEDHGHFPPTFITDDTGKPMHSWRVLILPYLEESTLFAQYNFDEPWDGPNNSKLGRLSIGRLNTSRPSRATTARRRLATRLTICSRMDTCSRQRVRTESRQTSMTVRIRK